MYGLGCKWVQGFGLGFRLVDVKLGQGDKGPWPLGHSLAPSCNVLWEKCVSRPSQPKLRVNPLGSRISSRPVCAA